MLTMDESPDLDTAFFTTLEIVNGGNNLSSKDYWGNSIPEIREEERRKHRNADASRERMIKRMTKDRPNTKENPNSGTCKIPLWSN